MLVIALVLFGLGLALGSFVNALVWRLHEQQKGQKTRAKTQSKELSILNGRSICPNCRHVLAWYDLVPVISWLLLRGKCRYCKKPISIQYPAVELAMGLIFAGSYLFWPSTVHLNGQWLLLSTWLAASVGLLALAVYDLRWFLLPNTIIYPTLLAAATGRLAYLSAFEKRPLHGLFLWAFSLLIASGVFFVLFTYSKGKWIGFGDVRLGLITGTLLADPQKSLAMLFLASLIGTVVILPSLSKGNKTLTSKLPYGPFLIAAAAIMVIFGDSLLNWYKGLIL
ncbi:prepilin peptidase [Candidatus Saccharibacteria bacterium]|nr:prepilin peptidase [Candidatus Saccharibacteria bacterium]